MLVLTILLLLAPFSAFFGLLVTEPPNEETYFEVLRKQRTQNLHF